VNQPPHATDTVQNQPIYWFALLERAVSNGDHAGAARAQRELARLGVRVAYGRSGSARKQETAVCLA
jgi:hypothetical protein